MHTKRTFTTNKQTKKEDDDWHLDHTHSQELLFNFRFFFIHTRHWNSICIANSNQLRSEYLAFVLQNSNCN